MTAGELRVWAPYASAVSMTYVAEGGAGNQVDLQAEAAGWWSWAGDPAAYGRFDYAFSLDGGPARPDPRSAWQPYGVHGASRWFDAGALTWTDTHWRGPRKGEGTLGGVLYELHVGTFTPEGTFDAAQRRLDHLVALGVDVVELMPVAAFDGDRGWGYDGVAKYAVHDPYGGPAALASFVDAAHAHGLGVCIDVVHNHLGPSGNYLSEFGPYFTHARLTPWGPAVNLDGAGCGEVRSYFIAQALRWIRDFHVDAIRLDAVHALVDDSEVHFLEELSGRVHAVAVELGRPVELIAESDLNDPTMITSTQAGGLGMDAQWADDVHHALHVRLTGETAGYYADFADPTALTAVLTRAFYHVGTWSSFRGRQWGRPVDVNAVDGHAFVVYLQTHDQVGNRARGDRIGASLTPGQQAIGAALYLLSAFTPMIFMGEEWRASSPWQFFTSFTDEDLANAVGRGRVAEFSRHGWASTVPDPQDVETFADSILRWEERQLPEHRQMLQWYQRLIALRRDEADFRDSDLNRVDVVDDLDSGTFVMRRGRFRIVANFGLDPAVVELDRPGAVMAAFGEAQLLGQDLSLAGHTVAVVRSAAPEGHRLADPLR